MPEGVRNTVIPDEIPATARPRSNLFLNPGADSRAQAAEPEGKPKKSLRERWKEISDRGQRDSDVTGALFGIPVIGAAAVYFALHYLGKNWPELDFNGTQTQDILQFFRIGIPNEVPTPTEAVPNSVSIPQTAEPPPTPTTVPPVEYTLTHKDGITHAILELKDKWPKGTPMPLWLQAIGGPGDAARYAEAQGWYKPGAVKDSVVMYKGDIVSANEDGIVVKSVNGKSIDLKTRPFSDTVPTRR